VRRVLADAEAVAARLRRVRGPSVATIEALDGARVPETGATAADDQHEEPV
jgi:hypothetical protein